MTQQAIPVALYLRFSSEMQRDGDTIENQRRVCREFCQRTGRQVVAEYKDEAYSGGSHDRPDFQRMLADAERVGRQWREIVVYHTWRFTRSAEDIALIGKLKRKGVALVSASENYGAGSTGQLARDIVVVVGAQQRAQLAEVTTASKRTRVQSRARNNASIPHWAYDRINGLDVPNENAPRWREMRELYATGRYSDNDIARHMNAMGWRTRQGRPFSKDTIRMMMLSPFDAGLITYRGLSQERFTPAGKPARRPRSEAQYFPGQHEAIITMELYEQCQAARARLGRGLVGRRPDEPHIYLLDRLAICASCRRKMNCCTAGKKGRSGGKENYRCMATVRGYECQARGAHVREELLLPFIDELIRRLDIPSDVIEQAALLLQSDTANTRRQDRRKKLEAEQRRLAHMYQSGAVDQTYFDTELKRIKGELASLVPAKPEEQAGAVIDLESFVDAWDEMNKSERRDVLHEILAGVVIDVSQKCVTEWIPAREYEAIFMAAGLIGEM
jgi:DNA invertase Pin-like site-specific DNA recombinase